MEDVSSRSPTTFTGCPGRSTSTIFSNSRSTLVVATPPQSTGPFTGHGACQEVGAELGPGPNRWGRSAVSRARGPCTQVYLCSMLPHDDCGCAVLAELAAKPQRWGIRIWMHGGHPDLRGGASSAIARCRCALTYAQGQVIFESKQLPWWMKLGLRRQEVRRCTTLSAIARTSTAC